MGRGKRYSGKSSINVQSMDTGADVLANTMAGGFAKFKDIGLEYLNKKAIERGQESAGKTPLQKKNGVTQTPKYYNENNIIGSTERKAHNDALRSSYLSSLDVDVQTKISGLALKNEHDITAFNSQAEHFKETLMQEADPKAIGFVRDTADSAISAGQRAVAKSQYKYESARIEGEMQTAVDTYSILATRGAKTGDEEVMKENLAKTFIMGADMVKAGYITEDKNFENMRLLNMELFEQTIRNTVFDDLDANGVASANNMVNDLEPQMPKNFNPDEWKAVTDNLRTSVTNRNRSAELDGKELSEDTLIELIRKSTDQDLTAGDVTDERLTESSHVKSVQAIFQKQQQGAYELEEREKKENTRERNKTWQDYSRGRTIHNNKNDDRLDFYYKKGMLNKEVLNTFKDLDPKERKFWEESIKKRESLATKSKGEVTKQRLSEEVISLLGNFDSQGKEIIALYDGSGVDPKEAIYWIDQNEDAIERGEVWKKEEQYKGTLSGMKEQLGEYFFAGGKPRNPRDITDTLINENQAGYMKELKQIQQFGAKSFASNPEKPIDFSGYWEKRSGEIADDNAKWPIVRFFQDAASGEEGLTAEQFEEKVVASDIVENVATEPKKPEVAPAVPEETVDKVQKRYDTFDKNRTHYPSGEIRSEPKKEFDTQEEQGFEISRIANEATERFGDQVTTREELEGAIKTHGLYATMKRMQTLEAYIKKNGKLPPRN